MWLGFITLLSNKPNLKSMIFYKSPGSSCEELGTDLNISLEIVSRYINLRKARNAWRL